MKKIVAIIMLILIAGCSLIPKEDKISVILPTGIPLIALGNLLDEAIIDDISGTNLLISAIASNSHDIVIAPFNIGAKLHFENNSNYKLDSILTFGNTYIVSRKSTPLNSIADLEGKKMLAYGQNSIPEFVLNTALANENVNLDIDFQANLNLVLPFFLCNASDYNDGSCSDYEYILAAEPIISHMKVNFQMDINVLDLQEVVKDEIPTIIQAAIFVNIKSSKQDEINEFLEKVKENIDYLNENPNEYAAQIEDKHPYFQHLKKDVISLSIPNSNITYLKAIDNHQLIVKYCEFLNKFNPMIISNQIPKKDFYY